MKEMKQQNTVGLFMEQKTKKKTNNNNSKQPTTMYKDTLSLSLTHTRTNTQYFEYCDE